MKKILWKPGSISWQIHVVIAIAAVTGLILAESLKQEIKQPHYETKIRAAKFMMNAMDTIRVHRLSVYGKIDKNVDPLDSGMIGVLSTPITSTTVDLDAKLSTINPNWAAVVVSMLKKAGVKKDDTIAVSFTGSFPAINIAVLAAAKAMKLNPIIITSVSSSTWGANIPSLTWLDMEDILYEEKIFSYRSVAASLGGVKDSALGLSERGKSMLIQAIKRNGASLITSDNINANIDARMDTYTQNSGYEGIAAYVNVGGGTVATGTYIGKRRIAPGLNLRPSRRAMKIDSVMSRFAREGIPVINLNYMKTLSKKYELPFGFKEMPKIGAGNIYQRPEYNRPLVLGILISIILLLYIFIKLGIGYRIFLPVAKKEQSRKTGHMI